MTEKTKEDDSVKSAAVRGAWDTNAAHWDRRVGEGNTFSEHLVRPAEEALLHIEGRARVLEFACGNGVHSRRLARRGASVLATDISPRLIDLARARTAPELAVEYRVVDAGSVRDLETLPPHFDAVVCHMAIFDMPRIDRVFAAAASRLSGRGSFIVSSVHPCFNQAGAHMFAESTEDADGVTREVYGVRVSEYGQSYEFLGRAHHDSPVPHPIVHRPIAEVITEAVGAGLVLTGLVEPTLPLEDKPSRHALAWDARFAKIPPVIVYRFERRA